MPNSMKLDNLDSLSRNKLYQYIHPMQSLKQMFYFVRKRASLVNKGQNYMLHMLSLDTNNMAISYWQVMELVYTNMFSFSEKNIARLQHL